jgi:hypothetical protein
MGSADTALMRFLKKIIAWTAGLTAGSFVLVLLVILSLPQLVNLEAVKQGILNTVSSETGSQLTYSRLEILYLPRPSITLEQATLSAPGDFKVSLSALRVYPEIAGLLEGQIRLAALHIENPRFTYQPNSSTGKPRGGLTSIPAETVRNAAASLLAIPVFQTPGFRIHIKNGQLSIPSAAGSEIRFQSINARAHRTLEKLRIRLNCNSNLGRKISISAHVLPGSLNAFAAVRILGFRPHLLVNQRQMRRFFPIVDSRVDLDLKLQIANADRLRIELNGTNPFIQLRRPGVETVLKSQAIKVVANIRQDTTVVSFSDVKLDQPGLQVSGSLFFNRSDPDIRVDLSAAGIDVAALRQTALGLLGFDETVRTIFTIITGGHVPIITIHARGKSPADFSEVSNYIIRGNISGGDIFIPGVSLDINNVRGEASIADGMLRGTNISARLGNSSGKNGQLTFGLEGGDAPFHLKIETMADVAQIQPMLMRLVDSEAFTNELQKVVYLSGTAEGRLVIGERLDDLQVTAAVNKAHVFAEYARIPYPIVLSGGRYLFHSTRCVVDQVNARIGGAELQNLSIGLDWSEGGSMTVSGGPAHFDVTELTDWLTTFDPLQSQLHSLQFLDGSVSLSNFGIRGPLHSVGQWQYEFSGEMAQLGFLPAPLSEALWVEAAQFVAEPAGASAIKFHVPGSRIRWGASRMQFSGNARISATGADLDADLTIDTVTGAQISEIAGTEPADSDGDQNRDFWPRWLEGVLRVTADRFQLGSLTFTPVEAGVILNPGNMTVKIDRADLCGISVPGQLKISPRKLAFVAEPETTGTQLDTLFTCFFQEPGVVTGTYEMAGNVSADTFSDGFYRSLDGHMQFTSQSGRIYRHGVLAKILALLNVTEIFRGRLPDVVQKGFGYETIKIIGEFEDGKFVVREGVIDGSSMTVAFDGHYDLMQQTLDMVVLVAPFKTFDAIIQNLPLVSDVLGGKLISIPFRVGGKWDESLVRPAAVEEVDSDLLRVLNQRLNTETEPSQPLWPDRRTDRHHEHK